MTPSPRRSPAHPRHWDRIVPAVWELGWEEPGQRHHPGPPTRVKGQAGSFKPTSKHGHRHQLVTGAGRDGSCAMVLAGSWRRAAARPPVTSPPGPPWCCLFLTRGGLRPNSCHIHGFSPGCPPRSTLRGSAGGTSHPSEGQHRTDEEFPAG